MKKVIWVKFAWSDDYNGGQVSPGDYGWLIEQENKENGESGHELYNFHLGPDETYYCFVPPGGGTRVPSSADPDGWTVICLSKKPKETGIHIVGWYEDATLLGVHTPSPIDKQMSYCITSKTAYLIPTEHRNDPYSHKSIGQSPYSYLTGPGIETTQNKQAVLNELEKRMAKLKKYAIKNPGKAQPPIQKSSSIELQAEKVDPLKISFGTPEHRAKVEKAAENCVINHYKNKGYRSKNVTRKKCGHDFIFTKGNTVLHVEVKGTASSKPNFWLTRNEYKKGLKSDPNWLLALVTSALEHPRMTTYTAESLESEFDLEPYVYTANTKLNN